MACKRILSTLSAFKVHSRRAHDNAAEYKDVWIVNENWNKHEEKNEKKHEENQTVVKLEIELIQSI